MSHYTQGDSSLNYYVLFITNDEDQDSWNDIFKVMKEKNYEPRILYQCVKMKSESEVAQSCPTFQTPWTAAHQAPPSMGVSRQEYWSGLPFPSLINGLGCS